MEEDNESHTELLSLADYSTMPYQEPSAAKKQLGSTITIESSLEITPAICDLCEEKSLQESYSPSTSEASSSSSCISSSKCKDYNESRTRLLSLADLQRYHRSSVINKQLGLTVTLDSSVEI